jgi:hypothetical protein
MSGSQECIPAIVMQSRLYTLVYGRSGIRIAQSYVYCYTSSLMSRV